MKKVAIILTALIASGLGYFMYKKQENHSMNTQLIPREILFGNPEKINYNWEKGIEILIGNIWWISGKLNRFRSDNKLENVNSFKNKILNLLECLSFPLTQRMHWERSYGIPETLFLYLYKKISHKRMFKVVIFIFLYKNIKTVLY